MSGIESQAVEQSAGQATGAAENTPGPGGTGDTQRTRERAPRERQGQDRSAQNRQGQERDRGGRRGNRREPENPFAGLPADLVEAMESVAQAFNGQKISSAQKMALLTQMGIIPLHTFNGQTRQYTFPETDSGFRVAVRAIAMSILRLESFKRGILSGNVIVSDTALAIVKDLGRSESDESRIPQIILPLVEAAQGISARVNTAMGEMYSFRDRDRDRSRARSGSSQAGETEAQPATEATGQEHPAAPTGDTVVEQAADSTESADQTAAGSTGEEQQVAPAEDPAADIVSFSFENGPGLTMTVPEAEHGSDSSAEQAADSEVSDGPESAGEPSDNTEPEKEAPKRGRRSSIGV